MTETNNTILNNIENSTKFPPTKEEINEALISYYNLYNDSCQTSNSTFFLDIYYSLNVNSVTKGSVDYYSLHYKLVLSKFNNYDYLSVQTHILSLNLHKEGLEFQVLLGNSYLKIRNIQKAKEILSLEINTLAFEEENFKDKYLSHKKFLLAKIYYEQQDIDTFIRLSKESLVLDPTNYEAFSSLYDSFSESKSKLYTLVDSLNYPPELLFLKNYYKSFVSDEIHLTEHGQFIDIETKVILSNDNDKDNLPTNNNNLTEENSFYLNQNAKEPKYQYIRTPKNVIEVLFENKFEPLTILEAFKYYDISKDYITARNKLEEIMKTNSINSNLIILLCNCYYNLNSVTKIWKLAESVNTSSLSWVKNYCYGCYYLLKENPHKAKEYLVESANIKEVWIHLAKIELIFNDNSDKSASLYSTAIKRFPAFYDLYLNYVKVLILQGELKQAHSTLQTAYSLCQSDPELYDELGMIHFKTNHLEQALNTFNKGIELVKDIYTEVYFNLITNKGHALRKLGKLKEALDCYHNAMQLNDKDSNIACSIAFVYYSLGKLDLALDYYHKANYLNPENYMIKEMLKKCLEEFVPTDETIDYNVFC
jgi:tetratricopeptide (TPR) repeat protein